MNQLNTPEGMYQAVLDGIKKESTALLDPVRFNRLINHFAIIEWLNEKAPKNDYNQSIVDDLRNLYSEEVLDIEQDTFELPGNYHRVQSVSVSNDKKDWKSVERLKIDTISRLKQNPYRTPGPDRIRYYQIGMMIKLYDKAYGNKFARLFYLKKPDSIIYSAKQSDSIKVIKDLGIEQCKEIVDIAIRIIIERVKDERYQTILVEEQIRNSKK